MASPSSRAAPLVSHQAKKAASPIRPALRISAYPACNSRRGRVASAAVSASTMRGWWKAPSRFLPKSVLMPVLPPTLESTWANSVVGTCTKGRPRSVDGGGEARQVADHAAAERNDGGAAFDAASSSESVDLAEHGQAFARFAGRHDDLAQVEAGIGQARAAAPAGAGRRRFRR